MDVRSIIKEEIEDFQWIKDIETPHPEWYRPIFKKKVDNFIEKYASDWDNTSVTYEPISDEYNHTKEIGRIWMDEMTEVGEYNWYWDLMYDKDDETFIVELFEKWGDANSYEFINRTRLGSFDESVEWIFGSMTE